MAAQHVERQTLKRRGILAAAGAVVAGIVAKQTSAPVRATTDTSFIATGTGTNFSAEGTAAYAFNNVPGTFGVGVEAVGQYRGVDGSCTLTEGYGVSGLNEAGGIAVYGQTSGSMAAVYGKNTKDATSIGVQGYTGAVGIGVYGSNTNGYGVNGVCTGSGYGVYGVSQSLIGVYGSSATGTGVYGQTTASNQYGVLGTTYAANSTAIAGTCSQNGSSAFSGGTSNPNAYAAFFQGKVVVQGPLVVTDPSYKSGALAHPDGSHRLVYCVESPESWIEDVGKGQLVGGKGSVQFDKDFAAVTHTDDYRVFLTAHGDSKGLYVTNESAGGFEVREQQGGTSTLAFSWKVMVKAKSGVKSERLGKFTMPNLPLPDPSKFKAPEASKVSPPTAPPRTTTSPPVQSPPSAPSPVSPTGAHPPAASSPSPGSAPNPLPAPRT